MERYERPFYEKVWFIILMLLVFWPAGLVLLILRITSDRQMKEALGDTYRNVKTSVRSRQWKRSCRGYKTAGWILVILGGCFLISLTDAYGFADILATAVTGLGMVFAGGILLVYAKDQVTRWDRYESYVNNRGNTPISFLSEKMGYPDKRTRADIQSMINSGFFTDEEKGTDAYISGEYDLLVMTHYGEPFEPLRRAKAEPAKRSAEGTSISYIDMIHDEIKRCSDSELISTLCDMEGSVRRIEAKITQEPDLAQITSVKQMYESYLPQAMEFVKKFNDGEGSEGTMNEIKMMMKTCAKAFRNIEGKVNERDDTDTKVDMEVMKKTLEREGLLDSDFDIEK